MHEYSLHASILCELVRVCVRARLDCESLCVCERACELCIERSILFKIKLNTPLVLLSCDCCSDAPSMLARKNVLDLLLARPNIEGGA